VASIIQGLFPSRSKIFLCLPNWLWGHVAYHAPGTRSTTADHPPAHVPRLRMNGAVCLLFLYVIMSCRETFLPVVPLKYQINLYVPCVLYIGQTYRSSPQYSFYIYSQQIYLIIFLDFLSPSSFIPPQNVLCLLMLPFLVHKIFTFYINGVLNCKYPAPEPKG